jgi:NAD(P)-dependent dehydrogenase (short-subunit alcohol dehydrogenase family)
MVAPLMATKLDLSDRRLLVVGASSGVGRAVGRLASTAGARVAFVARRRERLDDAAASAPGEAVAVTCDVRSADDTKRAVEAAASAFGGLDALVYAAGMSPLVMLAEASAEEWRTVLETNLVGASFVTAAALPWLRRSGGRAVYVSSYAIRQPLPGLALYRVSKVALDALVEGWRMEHPDVHFTRVVLGNTAGTEFAEGWGPDRTTTATQTWIERGLFPAPTMMPLEAAAEGIVATLAVRAYVDDIAIMPRLADSSARIEADGAGGGGES